MQAPATVRLTIDASQGWFSSAGQNADQAGQAIVDVYSASLSHFVQSMRQQYGLGSIQVMRQHMDVPGLSVDYQNVQGHETIQLVARPESFRAAPGQRTADFNLEGYIAWVHPGSASATTIDNGRAALVVNGYMVLDSVAYSSTQTSVWVVMFGQSALRDQSLADSENPFKSGVTEPDHKKPVKLLNPVLPSRNPLSTPTKHLDVPGYFIFDWNDPSNYYTFDGKTDPDGQPISAPVILGGVQFAKVDKAQKESPLLSLGPNTISLQKIVDIFPPEESDSFLSGLSGGPGRGDFVIAEFYDRKTGRTVQQSWNFPAAGGRQILVNDKPLWWALGDVLDTAPCFDHTGLISQLNQMVVDLSQDQTTGVSPGRQSSPVSSVIADDYLAQLTVYFDTRTSLAAALAAAATAFYNALDEPGGINGLTVVSGTGYTEWLAMKSTQSTFLDSVTPVETDLFPGPLSAHYAAFQAAYTAFDSAAQTLYNVLLAYYSSMSWIPGYFDWRPLWGAYNSALFAYMDYKVNDFPSDTTAGGTPIDAFNHRNLTVTGGVWSFDDWTLGNPT